MFVRWHSVEWYVHRCETELRGQPASLLTDDRNVRWYPHARRCAPPRFDLEVVTPPRPCAPSGLSAAVAEFPERVLLVRTRVRARRRLGAQSGVPRHRRRRVTVASRRSGHSHGWNRAEVADRTLEDYCQVVRRHVEAIGGLRLRHDRPLAVVGAPNDCVGQHATRLPHEAARRRRSTCNSSRRSDSGCIRCPVPFPRHSWRHRAYTSPLRNRQRSTGPRHGPGGGTVAVYPRGTRHLWRQYRDSHSHWSSVTSARTRPGAVAYRRRSGSS